MRLDRTHIAIRRRSFLEICDLSIHVARDHGIAFLVLLLVGMAPWMVINYFLIGWMLTGEYADHPAMGFNYFWATLMLVCAQSQVGTIPITKYLGDATFQLKPRMLSTLHSLLPAMSKLFTLHFLVRPLVFVLAIAMLYLTRNAELVGFTSLLLLPVIVLILLIIRAVRPYVNEIILLEKTPLTSSNRDIVTYAQRTRSLHASDGGEVFGRSLGIWLLAVPIFVVFTGMVLAAKFVVSLGAEWRFLTSVVLIPATMWLTAGLIAVIRFLTYIDTRIYQEGWDVELKIRAEAMKFKERLS